MTSIKDLMKVSAVGVILLSVLAACQSKPESNPTPPPSDDDCVEVIIEQVVDGKVVDTRAVGRTDVVKYNGKSDGNDVAQIRWPDDVSSNKAFDFIYYAKPGLYLKAGGYRFNQTESPRMTTFGFDTYGQTEAIKKVKQKVTCYPEGHKKIYVRLEYKNVNNPNVKSDYDYIMTYRTDAEHWDYFDRIASSISDPGAPSGGRLNSEASGYVVKHTLGFTALCDNPAPLKDIILYFRFNSNSQMLPRHIVRKAGLDEHGFPSHDGPLGPRYYNYVVEPVTAYVSGDMKLQVNGANVSPKKKGQTVTYGYVFGFGGRYDLQYQPESKFEREDMLSRINHFLDYGVQYNYKRKPGTDLPVVSYINVDQALSRVFVNRMASINGVKYELRDYAYPN